MRQSPADPIVVEVVRRVRADIDGLVGRITRRLLTEIPFYATGGAGTPKDVEDRVRAANMAAVDAMMGLERDLQVSVTAGRLRARQGAPLDDVHAAYRIGAACLWDAVVRAAEIEPTISAQDILRLVPVILDIHDRDAQTLVQAYREEIQELALRQERERSALVEVVVSADRSLATVIDAARSLKLPMEGIFMVVAAISDRGHDPMPEVRTALAAVDVTAIWTLRYDLSIGVLSLPRAARPERVIEVLSRHATTPVGVSSVFTTLGRASWALDVARLVLGRMGDGPGVEQFRDTPMDMFVAGGREVARETARQVLGELLDLPPASRDLLLETLDAWVGAGGSADGAGDALHCHPNTVRKRLRRLEECTGRSTSEPGSAAELIAAARAWQQLEEVTPSGG